MTPRRQTLLAWTITGLALLGLVMPPVLAQTNVANAAVDLAGKILMVADSAIPRTVTNLFTFDRGAAAPFAVGATSLKVTNLDSDKLNGHIGSYYTTAANLTGALPAIDGSALTGIGAGSVPSGAIFYFNGACPAGYTEFTTARGYYIVGLQSGGTLATATGTPLTNLENRPVGQHTHVLTMNAHNHGVTDPGHTHNIITGSAAGSGALASVNSATQDGGTVTGGPALSNTTGLTVNNTTATGTNANSGSVAGTNAPYIELRVCQKT